MAIARLSVDLEARLGTLQAGLDKAGLLAERAQVGRRAAWYTVTRLVERGDLVVVDPARPAVLRRRQAEDGVAPLDLAAVLSAWR